jgi:hypothetical protein
MLAQSSDYSWAMLGETARPTSRHQLNLGQRHFGSQWVKDSGSSIFNAPSVGSVLERACK